MKVESTDVFNNVSCHKFIETPDKYYINTSAYDRNFSKVQDDNLGLKINERAQAGVRDTAYYQIYAQSKNMIGSHSVQISREYYDTTSEAVNGVVRDSYYTNIYYLITGCDKYYQLAVVDENTGEVKNISLYLAYFNSYNYNYSSGTIEILTQTEEYLYILCQPRTVYGGSYTYCSTYQVVKVKKSAVLSNVVVESKMHCVEHDEYSSIPVYSHHAWEQDKAYKVYENRDCCLVLSSTVNGGCVLVTINKNNNTMTKRVLDGTIFDNNYKRSTFKSESFVKDNILYTYILKRPGSDTTKRNLNLVKIDLKTIGDSNTTQVDFEECSIDISHLTSFINNNGVSYISGNCKLIVNLISDKLYLTATWTVEGFEKCVNDHIVTYESSDYKTFTKINTMTCDMIDNSTHVIKIDENNFLMTNRGSICFYAFNKIKKHYVLKDTVTVNNLYFVTKTLDGNIFAQDKYDYIHKIETRSNIYVNTWFDKDRYKVSDIGSLTNLNVSVEDDYGNYLNKTVTVKLISGAVFEDNSTEKSIVISDNTKKSIPVKITQTGQLKVKVR